MQPLLMQLPSLRQDHIALPECHSILKQPIRKLLPGRTTSREPTMAVRSPQDIYARHVSSSRGYPMWTPEPSSQLLSYRPEGLRIGDVGVVVPENGNFDVFFNLCLPKDHHFHQATGVPDGFSPIELSDSDIKTVPNVESAGQVLTTSSVTRVGSDGPCASCELPPRCVCFTMGLNSFIPTEYWVDSASQVPQVTSSTCLRTKVHCSSSPKAPSATTSETLDLSSSRHLATQRLGTISQKRISAGSSVTTPSTSSQVFTRLVLGVSRDIKTNKEIATFRLNSLSGRARVGTWRRVIVGRRRGVWIGVSVPLMVLGSRTSPCSSVGSRLR